MAAATDNQLVAAKKMTGAAASTPSGQQIARMERDLAALQTQVKSARKLTASTICILPSHADTLPSSSPTLASPGGFRITAKNILGSFRKSLRSMRSVLSRRPRRRKVPYGAERGPPELRNVPGLFVQDRIMYHREARQRCDRWQSSGMAAILLRLPSCAEKGRLPPARMQSTTCSNKKSLTPFWISSRRISALDHSDLARLLNGEAAPSAKPL